MSQTKSGSVLPWLLLLTGVAVSAPYLYFFAHSGDTFNDFSVFWMAAVELQRHSLAQVYDAAAFQQALDAQFGQPHPAHPFVYPPYAALLFAPFAELPFRPALLLWNGLSLAFFLAALRVAAGRLAGLNLLAAIAPATAGCLLFGQTGLLTSGLALLGLGLLERRPLAAGAVLGLLALKPQLGLPFLLLLLALGRYRAAVAAAVTVAAMVAASLCCFGSAAWIAWLQQLHGFSGDVAHSAVHRLYGVSVYFALLGLGLPAPLALGAQLLVLCTVLWAIRRAARGGWNRMVLAASLLAGFLMPSYTLLYDLPAAAVAALLLTQAGRDGGYRRGEMEAVLAVWCLPLLLFVPGPWSAPAAVLSLGGLFLLSLRRAQPPAAA